MSSPKPAVDGVNDLRRTNEFKLDGLVRALAAATLRDGLLMEP
jgi:hypothetical protein